VLALRRSGDVVLAAAPELTLGPDRFEQPLGLRSGIIEPGTLTRETSQVGGFPATR
jgi:hypothetical protein